MKLVWNAKLVMVAVDAVSLSIITIFKSLREPQIASIRSFVEQNSLSEQRADKDVLALVNLGSRVAGTPKNEKALAYLSLEYQKVGYETYDVFFFHYWEFLVEYFFPPIHKKYWGDRTGQTHRKRKSFHFHLEFSVFFSSSTNCFCLPLSALA